MTRLLFVGWDAADWKIIDPLLKRGEMPNLARVLDRGVRGNLATIYPPLSPMVWTTIATGKRPPKHGVHGFTEPTDDGLGLRPITNLGRTTKAFWNILNQNGKRSIVVGWWPSHPAEPIRGVMLSNHFPFERGDKPDRPLQPGTVSPAALAERLGDLRMHPTDIAASVIGHFVPDWRKIDQEKDKSLHDLAGIIAETTSVHAAATELLEREPWDLAAVYYTGIDHFSHRFMRYHARKVRRRHDGADPALFRDLVRNAYRYHDAMLGRLLVLAGPETAVMIISDHGFHSDRMLPDHIPTEAAGPAVEHRDFGIFCLKAPGVLLGGQIYGASVIDVAPTVLYLFGLPAGRDMDGKVLINAFESHALPEAIPSWDEVPGEDGRHPPDRHYDGTASVEALNQLVALGYVAPPGEDIAKTVKETIAENRYNLARAQIDSGRPDLARPLLQALIGEDSEQLRYYQHLFQCLMAENAIADCGSMLDAFDLVCEGMVTRVRAELDRRRREKPDRDLDDGQISPDRKEIFERRQLLEKSSGYVLERLLMRCRLALAERRKPERRAAAQALLERLADNRAMRVPLALFLAEGFALVGEYERALEFARHARRADRENWRAFTLEAEIHAALGNVQEAAERAIESLALVYFQPLLHHRLGVLFLKRGEVEAAEKEFLVALSQAPGIPQAHQFLARIMRRKGKLAEASVHMAKAELLRRRAMKPVPAPAAAETGDEAASAVVERGAVGAPSDPARLITIVTGLPRTGTSMMMQMLSAGGLALFSDGERAADPDNPRGYLEHVQVTRLHLDKSWIPEARGKALKIVAPLLPLLPESEEYRLIFMHRDLAEVVSSQGAMITRRRRGTAPPDDGALMRACVQHLVRARAWIERNRQIPVLPVKYADALADPAATAARLASFLGAAFDPAGAAASVDAGLRRQKLGA